MGIRGPAAHGEPSLSPSALLYPLFWAPGKLSVARVQLRVRGRGKIVKRRSLQTRSRAGSGPSQRAERKLCLLPGWASGGLAPGSPRTPSALTGRLEAAPPPAGLGARARCSRGTAGRARLQAVGEAGGRGGARPELGGPCAGGLPLGLACLSFQFGGWGCES